MSWFTEEANVQNFETTVEKQTGYYAESGCYTAKIKFAGVYQTEGSPSKGLYISFELDNGIVFDQYVNFIGKDGKSTRTNSEGKEVKGFGIDQIESWGKIVNFGKPSNEVEYKMWGKERKAKLLQDAIGKKVGVCVRHIKEPSEDGSRMYDKNEAELLFDIESKKSSAELYFDEEDRRYTTVAKWEEKIAEKPILERKPKGAKVESSSKGSEEAQKALGASGW